MMKQGVNRDNLTDQELRYVEFYGDIIKVVIEEMKKQNMSQRELGELTGLQQPAISRLIKMDKSPRLDTLHKVLQALNIEVNFNVR